MSARSKLWRAKRCRWPLIALCSALLSLLTRNAAAITVTPANGDAAATNAATTYQQNRNYEDTAAGAVVTAAMSAAALPMAKTTNDYAQQLPRYYAALMADVADNERLGATAPIYRNYFESTNTGSGDKSDAATVILRDHMTQWHLPAAGGHVPATITTDESAMTAAGFLPTTMTAAGQYYVASTSADGSAAVGHAHAGADFSTSGARLGGNAAHSVSGTGAGAAYTYEYAMPKGKIDYEFNKANYQSAGNADNTENGSGGGNGAEQVAVTVAEGGEHMGAADAYDMYRYDANEYARQMQRALSAASVGGKEAAAVDESGNQGVSGNGGAYFENQLPSYENYFMPTYQLEQFSNYHGPAAEQELKRQQRQNEQPTKADVARQEEQRAQLRPLTLFDSADDNNAMLQQFKKSANIENDANDRQKLHYFGKQPQLEPQQQQQQRQRQSQQQYQVQQQLQEHYQQQLQKQVKQQQLIQQQQHQLSQQQQQLQLSHQPRKFPELMHFSLHQHLPHQRQRLATTLLSKVVRPHNPLALSTRRRRQQRRDATSRQVIGNAGTQSSQPTVEHLHADADGGGKSKSNSNTNANGDTLTLQNRLGNGKRSSSDNFVDINSEPTQFSYARVYPAHVSQLLDDSANEIDDTPNNIDDSNTNNSDDNDNDNDNDNEDEDETKRRDHQQHYLAAISHPQVKAYRQLHNGALVQQYSLPPITTSERHTPASTAALAGIPLARHVEVTKHIAAVDYERVHVPYNHSVPIRIPQPIITAVPRPYAIRVPVTKTVAVPKVQEVRIPIEKVKPFPVERPVPFLVERRVPYMVEKQVAKPVYYPYPVKVPIVKTIVHKIPRRTHSYTTYQPHASSYPISMGQYHLQQQPHLEAHSPPPVHYAHTEHLG